MKYRAIIRKKDDWWIGWLVDLPGVNAQERTHNELIESLRVGAKDLLETECEIPEESTLETIEV